jgi:hypothetical protein
MGHATGAPSRARSEYGAIAVDEKSFGVDASQLPLVSGPGAAPLLPGWNGATYMGM